MSHNVETREYAENVNKKRVQKDLDLYVAQEDWQEGCSGLCTPIRWYDTPIMEDEEAAEEFIEKNDKGWYDSLAVKFYVPAEEPHSAKLDQLKERADKARKKWLEMYNRNYFENFKSAFVTCKRCGSKLNVKELGKRHICPVCDFDMRSDTFKERVNNAEASLKKAQKDVRNEELRLSRKQKREVMWLVKIEYHT